MTSDTTRRLRAVIRDQQHCVRFADSLQLFHKRHDFMDLEFVCARGHKVYAHKLLLCSISSKIKSLIMDLPCYLETVTIHLPDFEARLLRLSIDFLYEGSVQINQSDFDNFQELMSLLGIVLSAPPGKQGTASSQPPPPVAPAATQPTPQVLQQPVQQTPQVVYLQAPPNSTGQVQYVMATSQGQVVQGQMVQVAQPSSQTVVMNQASGQMVQAGTVQVPQNSIMQLVPQNSTQVVPVNNQMVSGTQIVQCSNQMVHQNVMNTSNQMPGAIQNQRPQYVMSSTSNRVMTSRARTQYNTTQATPQRTVIRGRTATTQPVRTTATVGNVPDKSISTTDVLAILEENSDKIDTMSARQIRELLEQKFGTDLSDRERQIEEVLRLNSGSETSEIDHGGFSRSIISGSNNQFPKIVSTFSNKKPRGRRKRNFQDIISDDDSDEDFDPKKGLSVKK